MHRQGFPPIQPLRVAGKPDRLLRASVTAFCSIPRPSRREIVQLDDLAVPLLPQVSHETLRFVAAALSENPGAPPTLVRRLADMPLDISAPILLRSTVLTNIDLIALIGRHGAGHARAIAARSGLDERMTRLIRSIGALQAAATASDEPAEDAAEETRRKLHGMMRPAHQDAGGAASGLRWREEPNAYRKLRSTALSGVPALFHTALAAQLGIPVPVAASLVDGVDPSRLIVALRAAALSEEEAFLVFQAVWPASAGEVRLTSAFIDAFQTASLETARAMVASWAETDIPHQPGGGYARGGGRFRP